MFFLLLVAPFALQYHFFFPDEMYYLDGAIFMQQNHDYLTPTTHSGELRFNKPILSYYLVLLGHKLFGINAFSSRFFFLLAGALTVLLAYCIGKTISNNKHTASLSAMIAASHPILILSSTRSIPDILLALFVTLSALGVAGLIRFGNKAPTKYLWFFYLGLAFAFEVKGLPAAALGGLAFVFLLVSPAEKISIKKLLHWPSLLITIILAFWWFAVMYSLHGNLFIEGFMEDQVGVRFRTFALRFLSQFVLAVLMMAGFFLPWVLLLIPK
jgi:4-amino-4-deoxy-L-arabinose transferase-like glycosyltransferase